MFAVMRKPSRVCCRLLPVVGVCPVDEFVDEVDKCNRLKTILPWVQAKVAGGLQDPGLYNALVKILVDQ